MANGGTRWCIRHNVASFQHITSPRTVGKVWFCRWCFRSEIYVGQRRSFFRVKQFGSRLYQVSYAVAIEPDPKGRFGDIARLASDDWRHCPLTASAVSASIAAGYDGFLSTLITRGIGLPDASIAFTRKRLAAAAWRFAVSRKSIVWPVESSARYRYLSWPFTLI